MICSLAFSSNLQVTVNLIKNKDGLYTVRNYKQGLLLFLSTMLGSVFGIMGAFSGIMRFVEGNLRIIKEEMEKRRYFENLRNSRDRIRTALSTDLDLTSIVKSGSSANVSEAD